MPNKDPFDINSIYGLIAPDEESLLSESEMLSANAEIGSISDIGGIVPTIPRPMVSAPRITIEKPSIAKPIFSQEEYASVDEINRRYGLLESAPKIGETKETQSPIFPSISTLDKPIIEPPKEPEKPSIITDIARGIPSGIIQLGDIAGGLIAVGGEVLGSKTIQDIGKSVYEKSRELGEPFRSSVESYTDIHSIGDAVRYLGHGLTQMLPFMIGTMGTGAIISKVAQKTLGRTIVKKAAEKAIANALTEEGVNIAVKNALTDLGIKTGIGGVFGASIIAETGIIAGERLERGMRGIAPELLWAIPAGFMDALPQWRLISKMGLFGRRIADIAAKGGSQVAKRTFIREFAKQGFLEGSTEGAQEIMEAMGTADKPFTRDALKQAVNAFIIAGFTGGIIGAATNIWVPEERKRIQPPPLKQPPIPGAPITPVDIEGILTQYAPDLLKEIYPYKMGEYPVPIMEGVSIEEALSSIINDPRMNTGTFWTDIDPSGKGFLMTDYAGGKLEVTHIPNQSPGQEFLPLKYTDVNNREYSIGDGPLPIPLLNNITTYQELNRINKIKERGPAEVTTPSEPTPPPKSLTEAGPINLLTPFVHYGAPSLEELSPEFMGAGIPGEEKKIMQEYPEFYGKGVNAKVTYVYHLVHIPEAGLIGKEKYIGEIPGPILKIGSGEHQNIMTQAKEEVSRGGKYAPEDREAIRATAIILAKKQGYTAIDLGPPGMILLKNQKVIAQKIREKITEETKPKPSEIDIKGILPATIVIMPTGISIYAQGVTHGQNVPSEILNLAQNVIPGWLDASNDEFYTNEVYAAKRSGMEYIGIPRQDIESATPETIRNVLNRNRLSGRFLEEGKKGMSVMDVQRIVDNFEIQLPKDVIKINVYETYNTIPQAIKKELSALQPTHRALYDRNTNSIYLIADNHASEEDIHRSLFHELLGHFGMERLIGSGRLNLWVDEIHNLYSEQEMADIYSVYGLMPGTEDSRYTAAMEKIAQIAESGENPTLWNRFVTFIKEILGKIFGDWYKTNLTEEDIRVYLWRSRQLIESEKFYTQMKNYNSLVALTRQNMYKFDLPDKRFSMHADSSPSDESSGINWSNWKNWYQAHKERNEHFAEVTLKDLGVTEAIASLPHWIAMGHPDSRAVVQVQWDRQDKRNVDRIFLMKNPISNEGDNPYLSVKNTLALDKLITWSEQNNYYLKDEKELQSKSVELNNKALTPEEIAGYYGWKSGFDRAIDYIIKKLRQISLNLYSDQIWFEPFRDVFEKQIDPSSIVLEDPSQQRVFNSAVAKTQERWQQIKKREQGLRAMNFYAPHIRGRGDYIVRVFDIDEEGKSIRIWVERFNDITSAELGRQKLSRDYPELRIEKTHEPTTTEFIYGGLDIAAMEAFLAKSFERAGKFGLDEATADKLLNSVYQAMDEEIMARGFRQHYIYRHHGAIIGGYRTENLKQIFTDYMSGLAGAMSKLEASYDFHRALGKINALEQPKLYEYWSRYIKDMLRNPDAIDRKVNALKTLPYAWYLSMNLRLAVTQFYQNFVTAGPILHRLAKEVNVKPRGWQRISEAMISLARNNLTDEEHKMLQEAYEQGETMANYINEIKGRIEGKWAKKYFQKIIDIASIPFAGMERFNRRSSLLAAFRMYREAGKDYNEAFELSREFVRHAHYAYGLNNYPQILREGTPFSKMASMAYVFKSFPHNYVLSMLHFMKNREGKIALDVMFRSIAAIAILGGLPAIPLLDDLLEEYEKLSGNPIRSKMRTTFKKIGGEILSDTGMEGLAALIGIDMSGSVKINIPIPGIGSYDPTTTVFGVWSGLIDKGKRAIDFVSNGDTARAIEAAAPTGIEMMMKSIRLAKEGLRTGVGRQILGERGQPIKPTEYETALQLGAFRPQRIAEIQKERRTVSNIKEYYSKSRTDIYKRLRTATSADDLGRIRRDIQLYNMNIMKFKGLIPKIDISAIRTAYKPAEDYMEYKMRGNF